MSQLISKTDFESRGEFFETHIDVVGGDYQIKQAAPSGVISAGYETILLNKEQAVIIARTILRNEGITNV